MCSKYLTTLLQLRKLGKILHLSIHRHPPKQLPIRQPPARIKKPPPPFPKVESKPKLPPIRREREGSSSVPVAVARPMAGRKFVSGTRTGSRRNRSRIAAAATLQKQPHSSESLGEGRLFFKRKKSRVGTYPRTK